MGIELDHEYMKLFWDNNGLLNSKPGESYGENSFLYTIELMLLIDLIYGRASFEFWFFSSHIEKIVPLMKIEKGYYKQHPTNDDKVSHDQITALIAYSNIYDRTIRSEIWNRLIDSPFWYEKNNFMHPRDILYYGTLNKDWICLALSPILLIMMIISLFTRKLRTNGKILWFLRTMSIRNYNTRRLFFKLTNIILKPMYGKDPWLAIFNIYFPTTLGLKHPLVYLMEILYKEGIHA